jgi:hypothetical protein
MFIQSFEIRKKADRINKSIICSFRLIFND